MFAQKGLPLYRVQSQKLPSVRPNIVFRNIKPLCFVDGCFWHGIRLRLSMIPKQFDFWAT
ncbi:hypothetical protein [Duncaniella dubosii]|uniref:hypothetical protein n=1 Tax=Duncaniella dubosii TaxID=2518971 RepID=UPI003F68069B